MVGQNWKEIIHFQGCCMELRHQQGERNKPWCLEGKVESDKESQIHSASTSSLPLAKPSGIQKSKKSPDAVCNDQLPESLRRVGWLESRTGETNEECPAPILMPFLIRFKVRGEARIWTQFSPLEQKRAEHLDLLPLQDLKMYIEILLGKQGGLVARQCCPPWTSFRTSFLKFPNNWL